MRKITFVSIILLCSLTMSAQKNQDKAEADKQICTELIEGRSGKEWHPELALNDALMEETNERNVFCVKGDAFQVNSLRSDFYVRRVKGQWQPIFERRYPVESLVNLLMGCIPNRGHRMELRHHQYGNHIATMTIPLQRIHDVLGPGMRMYCRVAVEDNATLSAWLVFYEARAKYIHLLELNTSLESLFAADGTLHADLYANIPQDNIKSFINKR